MRPDPQVDATPLQLGGVTHAPVWENEALPHRSKLTPLTLEGYTTRALPGAETKNAMFRNLGKPIRIGSLTIKAGDYVMADRDGVVIIPEAIVGEVVEATEDVMRRENLVRKSILEGMDPREAYLKYGKF